MRSRWVLILSVILIVLISPAGQEAWVRGPDLNYGFSDLMINYEGGFVRRGFAGEIILFVSRILGLDVWALSFFVFVFILTCVSFLFVQVLFVVSSNPVSFLVLFLSPTLLLFYAYDYHTFFRKDLVLVLFLLSVAYSRYLLERHPPSGGHLIVVLVLLSLAFIVTTLVIDFALLFVPWTWIGFLLILETDKVKAQSQGTAQGSLPTRAKAFNYVVSFALVLPALAIGIHSYLAEWAGSFQERWAVALARARSQGPVWDGAFWAQTETPGVWFSRVLEDIWLTPSALGFWFFAVLAGPVLIGILTRRSLLQGRWMVLIALSPLIALFVAYDYGRWISLLAFAVLSIACVLQPSPSKKITFSLGKTKLGASVVALFMVVLFVASWRLPHCCVFGENNAPLQPNLITNFQSLFSGESSFSQLD